jgi:hypothetical protein
MAPRFRIACLPVALGLGLLFACTRSESGNNDSEIIDGVLDTNVHDSVVLVAMQENGRLAGTCTGTMVAPNLLLTARHCVSNTDRGSLCRVNGTAVSGAKITGDLAPNDILVYTGTTAIAGVTDATKAAARGKQIIRETATVLCNRDVAFVLLDTELTTPIAPIRLKTGARDGELLTAVGWGLTEDGFQPRKRIQRPNVPVTDVGPLAFGAQTTIGLGNSEFLVGEAFCSGDSGGPAFSAKGAVVGVVSRGGNGREDEANRAVACIGPDTIGFYTHLGEKAALVTQAFTASGFTPRDEDDVDGGVAEGGAPDAGPPNDAAVRDASPVDTGPPDAGPPPPPPLLRDGAACTADGECNSRGCVEKVCRTLCTDPKVACAITEVCTVKGERKACLPKPPNPPGPGPTKPGPDAGTPTPPDQGADEPNPPSLPPPDPIGGGAAPDDGTAAKKPAPKKPDIANAGCSAAFGPANLTPTHAWLVGLAAAAVLRRRRRRA